MLFHFLIRRVPVEFGKHLGCILMTASSKSLKFISIASLAGQLNQDVDRIATATIGKRSQFIEVTSLAGQLDELVNRILVASLSLLAQFHQFGIRHG